jgi:ribonucleotide monophosphatase NagD (HAD superfamily)
MRILKFGLAAAVAFLSYFSLKAQTGDYDVFVPIAKYLSQGNTEAISAWYADNLDITVLSNGGNASRNQAKQILKTFFESYTPRSFEVRYTAGRANMKYALGTLNAGGENFLVTIFVSSKGDTYTIQQIKIERMQ